MIKIRVILYIVSSVLFLQGCSKILEPVLLIADSDMNTAAEQEEFDINIKALTFKNAREANKDPYTRQIMFDASGEKANVFNETDFLTSDIPDILQSTDYFLGVGDILSFFQINEFMNIELEWPTPSANKEYLLGVGDELLFTQLTETLNSDSSPASGNVMEEVRSSKGVIGSDGNILLLGMGNIKAFGRTLTSVRDEVRNILIRSGYPPVFQLEITSFESKKAYLTNDLRASSTVIPINNLPITLKEVVLLAGLSETTKNAALISLTRGTETYRYTAGQLFSLRAPEILIKDKDQIEIQNATNLNEAIKAEIGSNGHILLPNVGKIKVVNKTVDQVYSAIKNILISKRLKPNFQLELLKSANKKAYLISNKLGSTVIKLTDKGITLKELVLNSSIPNSNAINGLSIITLKRNKKVYRMTVEFMLSSEASDIWIQNNDQIQLDHLPYKPGQVFALSGAGSAQIVPIAPSKRETLADILFVPGGAFANILAKRSEVYLLRGGKKSMAYHLDAQNVSRILVAARTELRPNDIIFVADRPIISFSRTLAEIDPLRILLRDIDAGNIP